jgi:phosphoribosyl-dephospho-CoA transferase
MHSPLRSNVVPPERHDLIFLDPGSWVAIFNDYPDLRSQPLTSDWSRRGLPLVARRPSPGEPAGIPVGLPLPPLAGKKRLSFVVQEHQIRSVDRPPALRSVGNRAPRAWLPTLFALEALASRRGISARVLGSLGWSVITQMDYLTAGSDLDFLLYLGPETNPGSLLHELAHIQCSAPMRLDGELIRNDGDAVNWRELFGATSDVLVKSIAGTRLCDPRIFFDGGTRS